MQLQYFKNVQVSIYKLNNEQKYYIKGFVKQFTVKSHFTCIDEATSSNMFLTNSLFLLI
jgi:hypothetical protein